MANQTTKWAKYHKKATSSVGQWSAMIIMKVI